MCLFRKLWRNFFGWYSKGKTDWVSMLSFFFSNWFQSTNCNHNRQLLHTQICYTFASTSVVVDRFTIQEPSRCHVFSSKTYGKEVLWQGGQCNASTCIPDDVLGGHHALTSSHQVPTCLDFFTAWALCNSFFIDARSSPKTYRESSFS